MKNLKEERKQTELDQHDTPANSRRRNDPYKEIMLNLHDRGSLCELQRPLHRTVHRGRPAFPQSPQGEVEDLEPRSNTHHEEQDHHQTAWAKK